MFVGRQNELKRLDGIYKSGKFECVIVHGRLRAGKTALLREFLKNKKSVYFTAQETSARENLSSLSRLIGPSLTGTAAGGTATGGTSTSGTSTSGPASGEGYISGYDDVMTRVFDMSRSERVVFVIDDYHFLAASQKDISRLICRHIDLNIGDSRLMLIICGSSEPVMVSETLGFDSPYHGRRTAQLHISPFTFFEAKRYYSGFSAYDIAIIYGLTGGVPGYLEMMDPELPVEENIRRSFFDSASPLFEEPANILRREVRDPAFYNAVLRTIASGFTKNSEIASKTGLETSACTAYLKNLIALGFVEKYTPVTEKSGKKTVYGITDNMFRFWYRFVSDNVSYIQSGMVDRIWRGVARDIPAFMAAVFEDICRQWFRQQNLAGKLPLQYVEIGRWWGTDPVWKRETSIPIVAYSDDEHAIFGDCVWSDEPAQASALVSLEERSRGFRYPNRYLYLFSRSGFSDECAGFARRTNANLVMFE